MLGLRARLRATSAKAWPRSSAVCAADKAARASASELQLSSVRAAKYATTSWSRYFIGSPFPESPWLRGTCLRHRTGGV